MTTTPYGSFPADPARHRTLGDVFAKVLAARGNWGQDERALVREGGAIRVNYPAGSASPSTSRIHDAPRGGAQIYTEIGAPRLGLRVSYEVRFAENFDPVKGGKLPGLYGVTDTGELPSGGKTAAIGVDSISARLMWRRRTRSDPEDQIDAEVYLYSSRNRGGHRGESIQRGGIRFRRGVWHTVTLEVVLNADPAVGTGSRILCGVDGPPTIELRDSVLRCSADLKLKGLFFSTFFGGTDPSWATPVDTHVDFRNFRVDPVDE